MRGAGWSRLFVMVAIGVEILVGHGIAARAEEEGGGPAHRLRALRRAALEAPENRSTSLLLADACVDLGFLGEADAIYRRLLESAVDDSSEVFLRLGNLELRRDRLRNAVTNFAASYYLGHESPELPRTIGELWVRLGDFGRASVWMERAIEVRPQNRRALILRASEVYVARGDLDRAETRLSGLLEELTNDKGDNEWREPSRHLVRRTYRILGQIAHSRGQEEKAAVHFVRFVETGGSEAAIDSFLGNYFLRQRRWEEAIPYLKRHIATDRIDGAAHVSVVSSWIRLGRLEEAREELVRYIMDHGLDHNARALSEAIFKNSSDWNYQIWQESRWPNTRRIKKKSSSGSTTTRRESDTSA